MILTAESTTESTESTTELYKFLLITFRALKFSSPQYINSLIEIYKPSRSGLRSSGEFSLAIPKSKRT